MPREVSSAQVEFVKKQNIRKNLIIAARILILAAILSFWEIGARLGMINDFIFSSPSRMAACFWTMMHDHSIFYHIGITVLETTVSFLQVTLLGIGGAVLLWGSRTLSDILEPYLVMLNSLPKSALAPMLIVWLGANTRTIVVAAVSVAVFGSILTLHNGFASMDHEQMKLIYALGGKKLDVLIKVLLPGSVPMIVSNMKVNVGLCLVGVIIGEFLAAKAGLGYLIIYGSQTLRCDYIVR